ncbi:MAG: hypothetical protein RR710_02820 [Oscillospiraceae bacterium]
MFQKFITYNDLNKKGGNLEKKLFNEIENELVVLDSIYGTNRTNCNDGGMVILCREEEDITALSKAIININIFPFEEAEIFPALKENFVKILFFLNNEFSITVILPISIVPENVLLELIEVIN